MSQQTKNTLKSWFITKATPLAIQFWHWMDSYWHKDEDIPAANIDGLQTLLDAKMNVADVVSTDQVGEYDPEQDYVYDADTAYYVSFSNADSEDEQYQTEGFYRLKEDAPAGEDPETNPEHWAYQGNTIGDITIDDVIGLREELDNKVENIPGDISFALSDETSDLTTDNDGSIEIVRAQTISAIIFSVNTAPSGSSILVDVQKNGTSILNNSITLTDGSTTVTSVDLSDKALAVGDRITADITQVGATTPGTGAKIYFKTTLS